MRFTRTCSGVAVCIGIAACSSAESGPGPELIEEAGDELTGGRPALESEFPATVLLGGCTGAKVGPRHFLIAAHCVHDSNANTVGLPPGSTLTVNPNNDSSVPGTTVTVQQTAIHPQWIAGCSPPCGVNVLSPSYPPDVAVIRVNELTPTIPEASIHATAVAAGNPVVMTGYGCENGLNGPGSTARFKLEFVTALSSNALLHPGSWVSTTQQAQDVAASYVITPGLQQSSTAASLCFGDSGGPLYRNNTSEQLIVGVNAYYTFSDGSGISTTNWHTRLDPARYGVLSWLQGQGVNIRSSGTCSDGVKNGAETGVDCGGSCTARCANGQTCEGPTDCQSGACVNGTCQAPASPCSGLCSNPTVFSTKPYQSGSLGSGATCHETTQTLAGALCGQFINGRTFSINGVQMPCSNVTLPAKRAGGYCFQAGAGERSWAWFSAW